MSSESEEATRAPDESGRRPEGRVRGLVRRLLPGVALLAFSTVIAAVMAEVAVRLVAPQQLILIRPDVWQPADTVGWLHRPLVNTTINTGERTVRFVTDEVGFRIGVDEPPRGDYRLLLLGDSFMEALQVEYRLSTAGLLEARLPAAVGGSVRVLNGGVGGWGVGQYLAFSRMFLARDSADAVVVVIYLGNDVTSLDRVHFDPRAPVRRNHFRLPRALTWREFVNAWLAPINDFLEVRSHAYILVRSQLRTLRMRLGVSPAYFPTDFLTSTADDSRWETTATLLAALAGAAGDRGIPTQFVLVPAKYQVSVEELEAYISGFSLPRDEVDVEQPNRLLGAALAARGLRVLDVLPAFRAAAERGVDLYGRVDLHLSREGHEVLVEALVPELAEVLGGEGG